MLRIIDEFTRECLASRVERRLNSRDVLDELGELFVRHGPPEHIRSDNGQRLGIYCNGLKRVARAARHQHPVHRAGQPLGRGRAEKALGKPFPADGVL